MSKFHHIVESLRDLMNKINIEIEGLEVNRMQMRDKNNLNLKDVTNDWILVLRDRKLDIERAIVEFS